MFQFPTRCNEDDQDLIGARVQTGHVRFTNKSLESCNRCNVWNLVRTQQVVFQQAQPPVPLLPLLPCLLPNLALQDFR